MDSADGAAVRIAMTAASAAEHATGLLCRVTRETARADGEIDVTLDSRPGIIHADLTVGANVTAAVPLQANEGLSCPGVKLHGAGFIVTTEEAAQLGLGRIPGLEQHIRLYRNGRDLMAHPREVMVIDLFGLSVDDLRQRYPEVCQWVHDRVKPERDQNNRASYRDNWWVFGEPRGNFRPALAGLPRYIATVETAKHRVFQFLDASILPDNMLVAIALDDAFHLGVLSSRFHVVWAPATGGTLEDRPRYNKTRCFETFPFPEATAAQQERIRALGEAIDAHRKRQQAQHPDLTLTDQYNVIEKLRAVSQTPHPNPLPQGAREPELAPGAGLPVVKPAEGAQGSVPLPPGERLGEGKSVALTPQERTIHAQGLLSVLLQLHDELDAAYGLPATAARPPEHRRSRRPLQSRQTGGGGRNPRHPRHPGPRQV